MTLNDAAVFVAVVQNGTFAGAAKTLQMPTSTVSRVISQLESRLGTRLLQRTTRSMTLTDQGQQFFEDVEAAVQAIQDASAKLIQSDTDMIFRLKLLASPDVGTEILPEVLVPFHAKHPNIHVDVELTATPPSLSGQKFDLAIWGGPLPSSSLIRVTLQNQDFGLFAAPSYLSTASQPAQPEDLLDHSCILMRPETRAPRWDLKGPAGTTKIAPPPTFTANDIAFLRNMVLEGGGIGPLPIAMARRWETQGSLRRVLPDHVLPGMPLQLLYPPSPFRSRPVEQLKSSIREWSKAL